MSPADSWQLIQSDLADLFENSTLMPFRPLLETLRIAANAHKYPAEFFGAFIEMIRHMGKDIQQGQPLQEVLDQAIAGTYLQPDWSVNSVFQTSAQQVFQIILGNFREKIEPEEKRGIPIPVVLAVMNADEARDLAEGRAFGRSQKALGSDFKRLMTLFTANNLHDWTENYHNKPELWLPFSDSSESIGQIMAQVLTVLQGKEPFVPVFVDIRQINDWRLLNNLRRNGCIVVIDTVSMHYPAIQQAFELSALDKYPGTSIVTIAPIQSAFDIVHEMTIVLQLRMSDMEFIRRMQDTDDYGACEEVYSRQKFQTWFESRVRKMYPGEVAAQPDIRSYIFNFSSGAQG